MHIVHGELRKEPFVKSGLGPAGDSTMFAIELSEMIKDYKTGEKTYTNYKAILFAKTPAHIALYQSTLVVGNFVVCTAEKLKIEVSECGQYTKLFMDNARLEGSGYIAQGQQAPAQQGGFQQQAPQQSAIQQNINASKQNQQQQGGFANQGQQQQQAPVNQGQQQIVDPDIPF